MLTRRNFVLGAAVAASLPTFLERAIAAPAATGAAKKPNAADAMPISVEERRARISKVQDLMGKQRIAALLMESGSTMEYFTGIEWHRSERTTAAIIPSQGEVMVVTPHFEEPSVRETLQVGGEVRPWDEHESPFELIVKCLRDAKIASGTIAVEPTTRFFIISGVKQAGGNGYEIVPGDSLVRACRLVKSPAELALMQVANNITLEALRIAHAKTALGMSGPELGAIVEKASRDMGGSTDFSLALLNEASAYPHGSVKRQTVHEGSVILMDCGCTVHGYQSDISRTWIYGEPSAKQRKVWQTVKRGQELALETAKLNVPVGTIDDTVRHYYETEGWGPGYHLPGMSHRTGHGIGLDGHEPPFLVHGDATPLEAGMCFSDEPGIYIPGEFGIRLEDCWYMTAQGPKTFTPLAHSLEQPI
ncbi:MAG TPA: Xaa-Pro peptidase family protein [Steroidobacteraceae bacterium]